MNHGRRFPAATPGHLSERDTIENTVKLFDWFKPKSNAPKGLVPIDVKFTADEQEAMSRAIERFEAVVTNAHAPEGTRMFTPPKVANAISAQGLSQEPFLGCLLASLCPLPKMKWFLTPFPLRLPSPPQ